MCREYVDPLEDEGFARDWNEMWEFIMANSPNIVHRSDMEATVARAEVAVSAVTKLLERYPDHPWLLEMRADHTLRVMPRIQEYSRAIDAAVARRIPAHQTRIRLAQNFVLMLFDADRAEQQLEAAEQDLVLWGDAHDRRQYDFVKRMIEHKRKTEETCDCGHFLKNLAEPRCPSCGLDLDPPLDISDAADSSPEQE